MRILSKAEIVQSFGPGFYEDKFLFNLSKLREVFGKYVQPLTLNLAKKLKGKTVFALEGQNYWFARTDAEKEKSIMKLKIGAFDAKEQELHIYDSRHKFSYNAYIANMKGHSNHFCTGSGCDYIYVFVTNESSIKKSRSISKSVKKTITKSKSKRKASKKNLKSNK